MILTKYLKATEKFAADNSPVILSAIAIVGTLSTAYLASKASFKAAEILQDHDINEEFLDKPIDTRIKVMAVWKEYVPAAGTALLTVTCIVCAHRIGTKRAAAMAVAYSISDKAFAEYKEKVVEKFGENKERQARDELAQERALRENNSIMLVGTGTVLCFDQYSSRYFESSMEMVKKAMNDTNYEILHQNYASLSDFYLRIGLAPTKFSDEVGWNTDHLLDIHFSTILADDQRPCLCLDFHVLPIRKYNVFG